MFSFLSVWFDLGFYASSDVRPLEIGRAHHHGCHRRHQIGTFPVVPLNAIVAHRAGRAGVENTVQIGGATCLKPPSCRRNTSNSWWEAAWVQFKLMNRGIQTSSCRSAETLNCRKGEMIAFMECLTRSGFRRGLCRPTYLQKPAGRTCRCSGRCLCPWCWTGCRNGRGCSSGRPCRCSSQREDCIVYKREDLQLVSRCTCLHRRKRFLLTPNFQKKRLKTQCASQELLDSNWSTYSSLTSVLP